MNASANNVHSHGDGTDIESSEVDVSVHNPLSTDNRKHDVNVRLTRSQEAVKTLLSSFGEEVERCSDEFANQEIKFRDLSVLSHGDLEMLGVKEIETQSLMLETFQELPNQEVHYDRYCSSTEAQSYNGQILDRAECHLNSINTSLSAAYLKMLVNPSNDVIVDETIFASRFVLEALEELKKTTDNLEDRLRSLEQVAERDAKIKLTTKAEQNCYKSLVFIGGICTSVTIAFWFWKRH